MNQNAFTRRQLLSRAAWTSFGGLSLLTLPAPLARALAATDPAARWDRTLVAIHLAGGNDGLNTIIPHADPEYRKLRPQIAIAASALDPLTPQLAMNRVMSPLRDLWKDGGGDLAIGLGVGYPQQNRSHFRSIEIWETASDSATTLSDGWIARLFAGAPVPSTYPADGVVLAGSGLPLQAAGVRRVNLPSSGDLATPDLVQVSKQAVTPASLAHVVRIQNDLAAATAAFKGVNATKLPTTFPTTSIGNLMAQAAKIIIAGKQVPVIMASHGSYDTHSGQVGTQNRLLGELSAALAAFRDCLIKAGKWDNAAVMTYAEFGRRAAENGSQGTDHGSASCHFVMGGQVKGGFYGTQPSLTQLEQGDPKYNLDFRSLYASVAREFWGVSAATATAAIGQFQPLSLFKGASA